MSAPVFMGSSPPGPPSEPSVGMSPQTESSSRDRFKPAHAVHEGRQDRPRSPARRLIVSDSPVASLYDWLMFLHILAAMVWVGGLVALAVFGRYVLRGGQHEAVARFIGSLRVLGPIMLAPAAVLVLVFGIWMVLDEPAWSFEQAWVWLALLLVVVAVLVGAVFLSRVALAAEQAVAAGDHDGAARQLARWTWGIWLILLLLVVATWDMVF